MSDDLQKATTQDKIINFEKESQTLKLMGSRNRLKPRIDLDLWAGYNGYQSGTGIDDYLADIEGQTVMADNRTFLLSRFDLRRCLLSHLQR